MYHTVGCDRSKLPGESIFYTLSLRCVDIWFSPVGCKIGCSRYEMESEFTIRLCTCLDPSCSSWYPEYRFLLLCLFFLHFPLLLSAKTKEGVHKVFETAARAAVHMKRKKQRTCVTLWLLPLRLSLLSCAFDRFSSSHSKISKHIPCTLIFPFHYALPHFLLPCVDKSRSVAG